MVQISTVDINNENDRQRLADAANELILKISSKYAEYHISDTPILY